MRAAVFAAVIALMSGSACGGATIGAPPDLGNGDGADAALASAPDAAPLAPPDAAPCDAGDARVRDPVSGHCLVYVATPATWATGRNACNALGGDLATPTSDQENGLLPPLSTDPTDLPLVWIGGTDAGHEGTWTWADGEPWVYEHWDPGEPNNGGTSGIPENCAVVRLDHDGNWDDRACTRLFPYYCELP